MVYKPYKAFIEDNLTIIDKSGQEVPFILNKAQNYIVEHGTGKDFVLKARQEGVSAFRIACDTGDFILKEHSQSIVVADNADNAQGLLERVKWNIASWERTNHAKIPLKYNSKYELHNAENNAKFIIGTSQNVDVGRSRTVTSVHLSEGLFYPHFRRLLAGVMQALVPDGRAMIESTANGFNEGKTYWDDTVLGNTGFNPIFLPADYLYDAEFLDQKKKELGRLYDQEYPSTPELAFITSGDTYFDQDAMRYYLGQAKEPANAI